ncbi:MAG: basic amino acid ABC transporter substrate-binding protein [Lachnospiraceae bacterium]|nr:basic amino acid ABC transporter substrate-binding protein [Lachnospiraceae bacterium]
MKKELVSVILSACMAVTLLAGCGGSTGTASSAAGGAADNAGAAAAGAAAESAGEAEAGAADEAVASETAADEGGADSAEAESKEATEAAEEGESAEAAEAGAASSAEAGDLGLLEGGKLIAGTNAAFPPFEYQGDDGNPEGFDMALIKEIGARMGLEVSIEEMEFDALIAAIGTKTDCAIAGMTVTDERKQNVDFSDSYYDAVQSVLVPIDSEIATADDLKGKIIGSQLGTTGSFIAAEIEGVDPREYNKALDAVNDLINGRIDAVIVDRNPAAVFASKYPEQIKSLEGAGFGFEPESYAIAIKKGNSKLVEGVNAALKEIHEDGTFDKLVEEYIGEAEE